MNAPRPLPDQQALLAMFRYEPKTGLIYWRHGRRAFTTQTQNGYMQGRIDGVLFYAHRVIWKMVHGTEPPQIDHRNGQRSNNKLRNLRAADAKLNGRNRGLRHDCKTGLAGVNYVPRLRRWRAYIQGRHLGYFDTPDAAKSARIAANAALGFTARPGKRKAI